MRTLKTHKRLSIKLETLRALSGAELARINGGLGGEGATDGCYTTQTYPDPQSVPRISPGYTNNCNP